MSSLNCPSTFFRVGHIRQLWPSCGPGWGSDHVINTCCDVSDGAVDVGDVMQNNDTWSNDKWTLLKMQIEHDYKKKTSPLISNVGTDTPFRISCWFKACANIRLICMYYKCAHIFRLWSQEEDGVVFTVLFLIQNKYAKYFHGNCNKENSIYSKVRCIQSICVWP